ncbi:MAG: hypothetical protein PVF40_11520 [Ectothiorhodospiraceae bacterium]|jgi:hypothetical protein
MVHGLVLGLIVTLSRGGLLSRQWAAVIAVPVLASLLWDLFRNSIRFSPWRFERFGVRADGRCYVLTAGGRQREGRVSHALIRPWLCVARVGEGPFRGFTVTVPADAVDGETHRRLRAALLRALDGGSPG